MSGKVQLEIQAARAFRLRRYREASEHLEALLRVVGENPHTLHVLALCHHRLEDPAQARSFADRALAADPEHFGALQIATELRHAAGEPERARELARRALRVVPGPRTGPLLRWLQAARDGLLGPPASPWPDLAHLDAETREWVLWARGLLDG